MLNKKKDYLINHHPLAKCLKISNFKKKNQILGAFPTEKTFLQMSQKLILNLY